MPRTCSAPHLGRWLRQGQERGKGADDGDTHGVAARDDAACEHAPSTLRITDTVTLRIGVDGFGKFNSAIQNAPRDRLRQQHGAGLAKGSSSGAVRDIGPVLEKGPARAVLMHNGEPTFETKEISPRLVSLASEAGERFRALARARHGFFARKRRVADAAPNIDRHDLERRWTQEARDKCLEGISNRFDLRPAGATDRDNQP